MYVGVPEQMIPMSCFIEFLSIRRSKRTLWLNALAMFEDDVKLSRVGAGIVGQWVFGADNQTKLKFATK